MPMALVTNGDATQQRDKIERHRLAGYFDAILIEGEFGVASRDGRVSTRAQCARWRDRGVDVGDHLEWTGRTAAARAQAVDDRGVGAYRRTAVQPHRIIRSLDELTALAR